MVSTGTASAITDQGLERVAGNADEPGFPLLLYFAHCRDGLVDDLLYIAELNIARLEQIHIVGLKPPQPMLRAIRWAEKSKSFRP